MKPEGEYNDTTRSDETGLDSTRQGNPDSEHQTKTLSAVTLNTGWTFTNQEQLADVVMVNVWWKKAQDQNMDATGVSAKHYGSYFNWTFLIWEKWFEC